MRQVAAVKQLPGQLCNGLCNCACLAGLSLAIDAGQLLTSMVTSAQSCLIAIANWQRPFWRLQTQTSSYFPRLLVFDFYVAPPRNTASNRLTLFDQIWPTTTH
jgi:hypothetical protein